MKLITYLGTVKNMKQNAVVMWTFAKLLQFSSDGSISTWDQQMARELHAKYVASA